MKILTLDEITAIEPRIKGILDTAKRSKRGKWNKYEYYKKRIFLLVGYGAAKDELRNNRAYETVVHELISNLEK